MKPSTEAEVEAMNQLLDDLRAFFTDFTEEFLRRVERLRSGVLAASLGQPGLRWEGTDEEDVPGVSRLSDVRRGRGSNGVRGVRGSGDTARKR